MAGVKPLSPQRLTTLLFGCLALLLVVCIILFPDQAFKSSLQGLTVWWKLVFPALLPFFIVTEIMRGLGVLHALGALLDPLLRLLFKLPGIGGWAIAVGFTAGAPSGAAAVGAMRKDNLLSRDEAERLLTLSHVLSPVFLITVVGVGFLQDAQSGLMLGILHYGSAILVALWQQFRGSRQPLQPDIVSSRAVHDVMYANYGLLNRSIIAWRNAQAKDGRTFGKLLGDSVSNAVQQLMAIGGLMMMFSVIVNAVSLSQLLSVFSLALSASGIVSSQESEAFLSALLPGLFEAHIGAYSMTQSPAFTDTWQYAILSALFAWGGLSTHAQVKSFTLGTDIRYTSFLKSRVLHAVTAFVCTGILWKPLNGALNLTLPVWMQNPTAGMPAHSQWSLHDVNLWPLLSPTMLWFSGILLLMLLLSVFIAFAFRNHHRSTRE